MKAHQLDGHEAHLLVTLFNNARKRPVSIRFEFNAFWEHDFYERLQEKLETPNGRCFLNECGGIYDMRIQREWVH